MKGMPWNGICLWHLTGMQRREGLGCGGRCSALEGRLPGGMMPMPL